jgi:hypothetical protein
MTVLARLDVDLCGAEVGGAAGVLVPGGFLEAAKLAPQIGVVGIPLQRGPLELDGLSELLLGQELLRFFTQLLDFDAHTDGVIRL